MRIDIHCHVVGKGTNFKKVYFDPYDSTSGFMYAKMWALYHLLELMMMGMGADKDRNFSVSTDEYLELIYRKLVESEELDGVVLLAMDAVYKKDGSRDDKATDLCVSNKFLAGEVARLNYRLAAEGHGGKRFYFGASVSPNRKDWKAELRYVIDQTDAVLLKWIPSVQHIAVDKVQDEFYGMMADAGLPLLCHVGPENSFADGMRKKYLPLDDFEHLRKPLGLNVNVVAAHCALPVFPNQPNRFKDFVAFMKEMNAMKRGRLWSDTSALSLTTRLHLLKDVQKGLSAASLVHGSDFPIPIDNGLLVPAHVRGLSTKEYGNIVNAKSMFDRDVRIKRAFGFRDSILTNAYERVLRISSN